MGHFKTIVIGSVEGEFYNGVCMTQVFGLFTYYRVGWLQMMWAIT